MFVFDKRLHYGFLKGSHGYQHTHDGASGFQLGRLYRIMTDSVSEHLRELSYLLVRFVGERFDPGGTVITRSAAVHQISGGSGSGCRKCGCVPVSQDRAAPRRIVSRAHNAAIRHVLTGPDS